MPETGKHKGVDGNQQGLVRRNLQVDQAPETYLGISELTGPSCVALAACWWGTEARSSASEALQWALFPRASSTVMPPSQKKCPRSPRGSWTHTGHLWCTTRGTAVCSSSAETGCSVLNARVCVGIRVGRVCFWTHALRLSLTWGAARVQLDSCTRVQVQLFRSWLCLGVFRERLVQMPRHRGTEPASGCLCHSRLCSVLLPAFAPGRGTCGAIHCHRGPETWAL